MSVQTRSFAADVGGVIPLAGQSLSRRRVCGAAAGGAVLLWFGLATVGAVFAQERPARQGGEDQGKGVLRLLPADAVTKHIIDIGGRKLSYTATAGTLSLYDQSGERSAAVFYTAYVAENSEGQKRPLTFAFNGGPGAASAYLHLGLVGPKVLDFGAPPIEAANARLRDNPDTWLDFTDLVLIDPIGTGWSRAAKPDGAKDFYNVRTDADVLAKVIALYVANNNRAPSPKYLLGESYGGFRAAKVARAAQREQGIAISGILMVSPMIEGAFQFGGDRFALGAALTLPSLAAAELDRRKSFSEQALADAEHFAMTDYLTTLAGPEPAGEAARAFYGRVAKLTGLPEDAVAKARGFVRNDYRKLLRAADHKVVSAYDATYAVDDAFPESNGERAPDPILDGFTRSYGGAFANYARDELGFKTEMTYQLLAEDVSGKWDWNDHGGRSPPSAAEDLRVLLAQDPSFRLLVGQGRSDMVTPYGVTRYILDHLPSGLAVRAKLRLHAGGHMFYVDPRSRHDFTAEAKAFFLPEGQ